MTPSDITIDLSRVHLVGIGGAGMSGLAHILLSRGAVVTGSDMKESAAVDSLRADGALIHVGHQSSNLELAGNLPTVVVTSFAAIPKDNPELIRAAQEGIPVVRRSDLLAELMEGSTQVLLAGTHGKTSTTSMTVEGLQAAGHDPSFAIGGQLSSAGTNAHQGEDNVFVAEADESDASLLRYTPDVAVITNIEPDHLDYFGSAERYFQVFDDFADRVHPAGHLVVCLDDDNAVACGARASARGINVIGYGTAAATSRHNEIPAAAVIESATAGSDTQVHLRCGTVDTTVHFTLRIPGHHTVLNATAALVAGALIGADPTQMAVGLSGFGGVRRRFELKGQVTDGRFAGTRVYDDYAHHPTEVAAVLQAAREKVDAEGDDAHVIVCFQPHLYTRTQAFSEQFARALSIADAAIVLDIFGAREQPIDGVDANLIIEKMDPACEVRHVAELSEVPAAVAELAQAGDLVLTMGAGSVTTVGPNILASLAEG